MMHGVRRLLRRDWSTLWLKGLSSLLKKIQRRHRQQHAKPLHVIEGPLMDGMNVVGDLFGSEKCSCRKS